MPHDPRATQLVGLFSKTKTARGSWESQWQRIADFCLGRREFLGSETKGRPRQAHIVDGTFQESADIMAAALQSLLISGSTRWFDLRLEDIENADNDEWAEWLDETTRRMHYLIHHPEGGFNGQAHEMLLDIVAFGSGCMYVELVPAIGIKFSARPLAEVYILEDAFGQVDTIIRRFKLTARQAIAQWPDKVSTQIKQMANGSNPNQEFEFLHVVMPRADADHYKFSRSNFDIASIYVSLHDSTILEESGYNEMPYMFARWSKDAGELYARGPGVNALPDALMLNRMKLTALINAEKAASPPILVTDDGVIGPLRTSPNGLNVVRASPTGMEPIRYLETRARIDISDQQVQDTRDAVRSKFYNDLLALYKDPRMSATQVLELSSRTAQRIGPMIMRLQEEWLEPLITRVFRIAAREGLLPSPPGDVDVNDISIDYVSPAASAQRNSDVQAILGTVAAAAEWGQIDQDVPDIVDFDRALRSLTEAYGGSSRILRTDREVRALRDAKNKVAMEQAMAQQQQQAQQRAVQPEAVPPPTLTAVPGQ